MLIGKRIDEKSVLQGENVLPLLAIQCVEDVRPVRLIICSNSSFGLCNSSSGSRLDILLEMQQALYKMDHQELQNITTNDGAKY